MEANSNSRDEEGRPGDEFKLGKLGDATGTMPRRSSRSLGLMACHVFSWPMAASASGDRKFDRRSVDYLPKAPDKTSREQTRVVKICPRSGHISALEGCTMVKNESTMILTMTSGLVVQCASVQHLATRRIARSWRCAASKGWSRSL